VTQDLDTPEEIDKATDGIDRETVLESLLASADPARHAAHLARLRDIGIERLVVHQVGIEQPGFIDFYAREVLPRLR
jgi:hypothetical protein